MNDQEYRLLRDALRREKEIWLKVDGYLPPWSVLIAVIAGAPVIMWYLGGL